MTPGERVTFFAPGTPAPKGSTKAFLVPRGGFPVHAGNSKQLHAQVCAVITADSVRLNAWTQAIFKAADRACEGKATPGHYHVNLEFNIARPKSHYGTGRNSERLRPTAPKFPTAKAGTHGGDVDKLARAVLDALTNIIWLDDSQVVSMIAHKVYAPREPGVYVTATRMVD